MAIEKEPTKRGELWFHRHNPRRSRGDNCHNRERRGGSRLRALELQLRRIDLQRDASGTFIINYDIEETNPLASDLGERKPLRRFDPAIEARRDALRAEIRDLEIRIPITQRARTRNNLRRKLTKKLVQLRRLEAALASIAT